MPGHDADTIVNTERTALVIRMACADVGTIAGFLLVSIRSLMKYTASPTWVIPATRYRLECIESVKQALAIADISDTTIAKIMMLGIEQVNSLGNITHPRGLTLPSGSAATPRPVVGITVRCWRSSGCGAVLDKSRAAPS